MNYNAWITYYYYRQRSLYQILECRHWVTERFLSLPSGHGTVCRQQSLLRQPCIHSVEPWKLIYSPHLVHHLTSSAFWTNVIIIIITTMFMVLSSWQSHCESSPSSFDECKTAPSGRRPNTKPDDLGCESACTGCQKLHPPSPFIIITQPESWYSFSRPSWLVTYRDGLSVHRRSPIRILTWSDVSQLRWSRPARYH